MSQYKYAVWIYVIIAGAPNKIILFNMTIPIAKLYNLSLSEIFSINNINHVMSVQQCFIKTRDWLSKKTNTHYYTEDNKLEDNPFEKYKLN